MKEIKSTAIVGMGALGLLFAEQIQSTLGKDAVTFIMDEERWNRHKEEAYQINGEVAEFNVTKVSEMKPVDLLIVATKSTGLESALEVMAPAVGDDTIIISALNGISSEEILANRFGAEHVLGCVAIGMDAMRVGCSVTYCNKGRLQIGALSEGQQKLVECVVRFFEKTGQPYEVKEDILHAMWSKFLLNVGVNQTCMVYSTTYQGILKKGKARDHMIAAMEEVLKVAQAEGVSLGQEDLQRALDITAGLNPDGYPSMRQDAVAHRASEVELFAGTIIALAEKNSIAVPVNEEYYQIIKEMECEYS